MDYPTTMPDADFDICGFALLEHDSLSGATSHARSVELFRDGVVRPSLKALAAGVSQLQASDDDVADFFASDLEELFQASVEGYLLTVQSMWERGLRAMLIARDKVLYGGSHEEKLQRAVWKAPKNGDDLHSHFEALMAFSLEAFDAYEDLNLLQSLGSAVRHGDGASARRVHELCPGLWVNWIDPYMPFTAGPFSIPATGVGPKHPSFKAITLPEALLEQMIQSVAWFWEDVDNLRCASFKSKHHTVMERLDAWSGQRHERAARRVWSADSPLAGPAAFATEEQ